MRDLARELVDITKLYRFDIDLKSKTTMYTAAGELESLKKARTLVAEQAEDEGLWFIAETAPEAYLQQELRRLHKIIESDEKIGDMV